MIYKFLPEALIELAPNKAFVINGDFELKNVTWNENVLKSDIPKDENIIKKCDELQAAEPLRQLREQRNQLLAQSDWMAVADRVMTQAQIDYRQSLRDLPETADPQLDENGNLTNVTWPSL
jgi:hypothetical protein